LAQVKSAYLDGELCALYSNGVPSFSRLQAAMDEGQTGELVFFVFDLLFLDGESTARLPLIERKERLQQLFAKELGPVRYSEHVSLTVPAFASKPASWAWKASFQSEPIGHTCRVTAGSGSSPSA
jgi:bifunctional non-homologous end joining protein LigD